MSNFLFILLVDLKIKHIYQFLRKSGWVLIFCLVLLPQNSTLLEFSELHNGIDCDCIKDASQNCIDYFARRVGEDDNGFKAKYFKAQKKYFTAPFENCEKSCADRATSIDIWNDESKEFLSNQKTAIGLAPFFRRKLLIFKIKETGCLVKHTPTNDNAFHHDLYVTDNLSVDSSFEFIQTVKITYHAV